MRRHIVDKSRRRALKLRLDDDPGPRTSEDVQSRRSDPKITWKSRESSLEQDEHWTSRVCRKGREYIKPSVDFFRGHQLQPTSRCSISSFSLPLSLSQLHKQSLLVSSPVLCRATIMRADRDLCFIHPFLQIPNRMTHRFLLPTGIRYSWYANTIQLCAWRGWLMGQDLTSNPFSYLSPQHPCRSI